ncbi:MAG TPA: protein translocase subunit SecF [Clostridiales bacterium]|nr:protein translocase subunit SecF [Clostridiales bacterium]
MNTAKFPIVKNFKIFALISLILIAPGLIGLITLPFGMNLFNMDVDFIGGTSMTFDIHQEVTSEISGSVIPELVEKASGVAPSSVQKTGDDGEEVLIKSTKLDNTQQKAVVAAMQKEFDLTDDDTQSISDVNATIGKEMQGKAIGAALLAVVLMLLYITFRFELTSGFAAITCLIHDLLVVLSAYIVFRIPFNTTFIAVALTILGYSINSSIIVFDRVRENRKYARREMFEDTVEISLWQTVGRTLNTSITTLLTVGMIFIFGVTSLRQFTLPMIIGIVAGAWSSLFLAGTLWAKYRGMLRKNQREKAQIKAQRAREEKKAAAPKADAKSTETPAVTETAAEAAPAQQPQAVKPKKVSSGAKKKRKKRKH